MIMARILKTSRCRVADAPQDGLALRSQRLDGEAHQQRDEQRLQHLAPGERGQQRRRDDPEQEVHGAPMLAARRGSVTALG